MEAMATLVSRDTKQPWRRRLYLPAYHIKEAAQYAHVSPQTVALWHKLRVDGARTASDKKGGVALSYMQLIEVATIAALRELNISLQRIRDFRDYVAKELKAEYPFAQYKFKTDGKRLVMDYALFDKKVKGKFIEPDKGGQLAWPEIIEDQLKEFDYMKGLAARWHLAGRQNPIVIDPQVAYGAPVVKGVPTWVLRERFEAGEDLADIAYDFRLREPEIKAALSFEGVDTERRAGEWTH
jgi:uncharacterized protein (DUF433 family)